MTSAIALAVLLAFSIATLWVPGRWALSATEVGAYLLTAAAMRRTRFRVGAAWIPAFLCAWGVIQLAAHWTEVPSATVDACFYWLTGACLVFLGAQIEDAERERFLNIVLAVGTTICLAGTVQLFTSSGNVFWLFPSGFASRVIGPFVSPNNYAAFVELLVPVALTRRGALRLPLAAALAATVAASGSRAGAVLVAAEIIIILAIQRRRVGEFALFAGLAAGCVAVVGHQFLWARFVQQGDPFLVRREFLESTIAMFRARPLHGFGLGTWPWTYPRFALMDPGDFANHSHNEWAQWAAEGGVPAFLAVLALLAWITPRAIRGVWAIGLLAMLLHSAVDYPFLRLGLAAWFFVLAGLMAGREESLGKIWRLGIERGWTACRIGLSVLLLAATCQVARFAYADVLYRRASFESVQRAARLADRAEYHFALAQLDPSKAASHLAEALAANPYDSPSRIALAQERELSGDEAAAEALLCEAAQRDHQFGPAWALANFYFRRNSVAAFWKWARRAADLSFGDRRSLFDLCFLVSADPKEVFDRIGNPQVEEPFLRYLLLRGGAAYAGDAAFCLARRQGSSQSGVLLDYVDAAISAAEAAPAWRVWNLLGKPAGGRGFDWRVPATNGIFVTRNAGEWRIEFSGREEESCELLRRPLPGGGFSLQYEYRTDQFDEGRVTPTGILWEGTPLEGSPAWRAAEVTVSGDWLRLTYRRPLGLVRAVGVLWLRNVRLEPVSASLINSAKTADKVIGCCK